MRDGLDIWGHLLELGTGLALVGVAAWLTSCVLFGVLTARWAGSSLWLGALLGVVAPILGPVIAAGISRSRRMSSEPRAPAVGSPAPGSKTRRSPLASGGLRWTSGVLLTLVLIAGAVAVWLPWFVVDVGFPLRLPVQSGILVPVLALSAAALVTCALLAWLRGWVYLGGMIALPLAVGWLAAGATALLVARRAQLGVEAVASQLGTVGDVVALLGLEEQSMTGLDASTTLLDAPPTIAVGLAWKLVLGAGALLLAWVVLVACWPQPRTPIALRGDASPHLPPASAVPDIERRPSPPAEQYPPT